ncbi:MAG: WG repeat-containing protein [Bacteroidia bacterium]|nr:WG repeat-containing protein [Bacteroidia bacterium]
MRISTYLPEKHFHEGLSVYKKNGLYGYINEKNEWVIPAQFEEASLFHQGIATVKKNDVYFFIDKTGKKIGSETYTEASPFIEGLAIIKKKNKYGFINTEMKIVIPCEYDNAIAFKQGYAMVKKGDYWQAINKKGEFVSEHQVAVTEGMARIKRESLWTFMSVDNEKLITEPKFEEARLFQEGLSAVLYHQKWGFIDKTGNFTIPAEYEKVSDFVHGYARVQKNKYWGIIDKQGKITVPFEYEFIDECKNGFYRVKKNKLWGFLDSTFNLTIPCQYANVYPFEKGVAKVERTDKHISYITTKGIEIIPFTNKNNVSDFSQSLCAKKDDDTGLWGYINLEGKWQIRPQYHKAGDFKHGLAAVQYKLANGSIKIQLINTEGKTIAKELDEVILIEEHKCNVKRQGHVFYINHEGKILNLWGFVNKQGKMIIEPQFVHVESFSEGYATVLDTHFVWHYIDKQGKIIIGGFEDAESVREGIMVVKKQGKWGAITPKNELVIPFEYENMFGFTEGIALVSREKLWGAVNKQGKIIIPIQYTAIKSCSEGRIAVKQDNKWGYMDVQGKWVINPQYDAVGRFNEGLSAVCINYQWGYIDKWGRMVIPFQFEGVLGFSEGLACVRKGDFWGYINSKGTWVIAAKYLSGLNFHQGMASVLVNRQEETLTETWQLIDKRGKKLALKAQSIGITTTPSHIPVVVDNYAGFANSKGEIVIENLYEEVKPFEAEK